MSAGLLVSGCTPAAEEPVAEDTTTDTTEAPATGPDFSSVQVALVPGGAHPYFQPWIAGGEAAVAEFGIGATQFNETGEWDQTKHNAAIDSMGAQGFNAFGIFGVSPTDINTTFQASKVRALLLVPWHHAPPVTQTKQTSACPLTRVKLLTWQPRPSSNRWAAKVPLCT